METLIRSARADDLETIVEFNCRLAQETEDISLERDRVRAGATAVLQDAVKGRYWMAEAGGRIVGQLMTTREWSDWRNGQIWWIQSVYVRDSVRRHGVFSTLYRHVESTAREDPEVCGIRLYVERRNLRAQRVYESLGMHDGGYEVMEVLFADSKG